MQDQYYQHSLEDVLKEANASIGTVLGQDAKHVQLIKRLRSEMRPNGKLTAVAVLGATNDA